MIWTFWFRIILEYLKAKNFAKTPPNPSQGAKWTNEVHDKNKQKV